MAGQNEIEDQELTPEEQREIRIYGHQAALASIALIVLILWGDEILGFLFSWL